MDIIGIWHRIWDWWDQRNRFERLITSVLFVLFQINIARYILTLEDKAISFLIENYEPIPIYIYVGVGGLFGILALLTGRVILTQASSVINTALSKYRLQIIALYTSNNRLYRFTGVFSKAIIELSMFSIPSLVVAIITHRLLFEDLYMSGFRFALLWGAITLGVSSSGWCASMGQEVHSMDDLVGET